MKNNKLFIIAGANGTGKTTLAKELLKKYVYTEFVNTDEIAKEIKNNSILQAGKIALNKIYKLLQNNKEVVIETTLSGHYIEKIINMAKQNSYEINLIYVFINDYVVCLERIKNRVLRGGHNVPEDDVKRRYYRSLNNFVKYVNIVDGWSLYYNNMKYPVLVVDGEANNVNILNENLYKLFLELKNE